MIKCMLLLLTFSVTISAQPSISITFDDGSIEDMPDHSFFQWNQLILNHLSKAQITSIFFVKTGGKNNDKGLHLLKSWDQAGHNIANHTVNHPYFQSKSMTIDVFEQELVNADEIISYYDHYLKMFRFPYLKEGNTTERINGFRNILKKHDYKNGHVTIDASDWYINQRLVKRLQTQPKANIDGFKQYYLDHIYQRAIYYENLAFQLNKRHINHTLLLHHNLTSALFLGDLIEMFKQKGWKVINAIDAYEDPIFTLKTDYAGESLIWAQAKDSAQFDDILRYPAEDSRYEKDKMDQLGL